MNGLKKLSKSSKILLFIVIVSVLLSALIIGISAFNTSNSNTDVSVEQQTSVPF